MTPSAPIDPIHAESLRAIRWIRRETNAARARLGIPPRDYARPR